MEHPVQEWQDFVHKRWLHLSPSEKETFSKLADLEKMFMACWSMLQPEDEETLDRVSCDLSVDKQPNAVLFYKEEGNRRFGRKRYTAAAVLYSKALSHASPGTEEMAICFANRSAVLFHLGHYSACLEDIERAKEHGYPERLKNKILHRQTECFQRLKQASVLTACKISTGVNGPVQPTSESNTSSLNHKLQELGLDRNPLVTNVCGSLRLEYSTSKGRHMVAAEDINQGEALILEEAFVSVIIPVRKHQKETAVLDTTTTQCDLYCHHCLGKMLASLPCKHCSYAKYCSQNCKDTAWSSYHNTECLLGGLLLALGVFCHTALRAVLVAGCDQVIHQTTLVGANTELPMCKQGLVKKYCSSYRAVVNLLPHTENHKGDMKFQCGFTAAALCKKLSLYYNSGKDMGTLTPFEKSLQKLISTKDIGSADLQNLGQAIFRHMLQLHCNAQAIMVLQEEYEGPDLSKVESSKSSRLATAMFPVLSMLNHSCDPNTSVSFQGRCCMVRASRPIKKGEEVCHCYGPHKLRLGVEERQRLLNAQYFFTCHCDACNREQNSMDKTNCNFSCPKCSSPLEGGEELDCSSASCNNAVTRSQLLIRLQQLQHKVNIAEEQLQNNHTDVAIAMLMSCLSEAETFLSVNHLLRGEISDHLAQAEASKGNWTAAAEHLRKSIQTVEQCYGSSSLELGHELFKLAQILFNGRKVSDAMDSILRAQQLLSTHYGPNNNLVQELQEMKICLLQSQDQTLHNYGK
ncbi:SET and MYND domain-containing protein 4 [Bombina bombina]|uniref:SET and MYND domain-containing protein 4 n=1 Tax=Bombina bombina TaxID=8345 RepID=UPI00235A493D|nr:SET and MYND domain-containing protein 4 [Bombina bombina]